MNLLQDLHDAAKELSTAVDHQTTAEVGVDVKYTQGLVNVQYIARVGSVLGHGKDLSRMEIGESLPVVQGKLLATLAKDEIRKRIKMHHLQEIAAELGMELVVKKSGGAR